MGLRLYPDEVTRLNGSPKESRVNSKIVGLRLYPDEVTRLNGYAQAEMRSLAGFTRVLMLHGLAHYERTARAGSAPA